MVLGDLLTCPDLRRAHESASKESLDRGVSASCSKGPAAVSCQRMNKARNPRRVGLALTGGHQEAPATFEANVSRISLMGMASVVIR